MTPLMHTELCLLAGMEGESVKERLLQCTDSARAVTSLGATSLCYEPCACCALLEHCQCSSTVSAVTSLVPAVHCCKNRPGLRRHARTWAYTAHQCALDPAMTKRCQTTCRKLVVGSESIAKKGTPSV